MNSMFIVYHTKSKLSSNCSRNKMKNCIVRIFQIVCFYSNFITNNIKFFFSIKKYLLFKRTPITNNENIFFFANIINNI